MKKIILGAASLLLALSAWGEIPKLMYPDAKANTAMLNEADDFIDDMEEGQQDLQSDAIYHALRGMNAELAALRLSRDKAYQGSDKVVRKEITGEGSARGMKMRLYIPRDTSAKSKLPLLVYFHGGGWTIGSLNSCAAFCDALAATGKIAVLAVDYSLAPENPYPAGLGDCRAAIEFAFLKSASFGSSPDLVSVGGDSSGGNLALAAALEMIDDGAKERLRSIVLYYPVLKAYRDNSPSWKEYSRGYGLDGRLMEAFNEAYLSGEAGGERSSKLPKVSPAHAEDAKLKKLPPVLMISPERDILFDQGKEFADRMVKLGHKTERIVFPGAVHLFITVKGQPTAFAKAIDLTEMFLSVSK